MPTTEPIVYFNGQYVPKSRAALPIEDRGTLFGDGVYEVTRYVNGRAFELQRHAARLGRSLAGIGITGVAVESITGASDQVVKRNGLADATVYWQVTRGAGPRSHVIDPGLTPSVLVMAYPFRRLDPAAAVPEVKVCTAEDNRWGDCWIKSTMLLPNSRAKSLAKANGFDDAVLVRDGVVTEGASSNLFIVRDGVILTHPADRHILAGITRGVVIELAGALGYVVQERAFGVQALLDADEAMLTGTTTDVTAVVAVDGQAVATAAPGPVTRALHKALTGRLAAACGLGA